MKVIADFIINALQEYFLACPLISESSLGVDYLPESGTAYSIDAMPKNSILKKYFRGSLRQYVFMLRSVRDYGSETLQNSANSGFFEELAAWLESQSKANKLPQLPPGMIARSIEAQSTGCLFDPGANAGKYQIQCRLIYFQHE